MDFLDELKGVLGVGLSSERRTSWDIPSSYHFLGSSPSGPPETGLAGKPVDWIVAKSKPHTVHALYDTQHGHDSYGFGVLDSVSPSTPAEVVEAARAILHR